MAEEDRVIRPFADTLLDHRKGRLHSELGEELNRLNERVLEVGKPGKLTVTFNVSPAGKGSDMVMMSDDWKVTLPKPDAEQSLFFVDEDFNLRRESTKQRNLPLRAVGDETPDAGEEDVDNG